MKNGRPLHHGNIQKALKKLGMEVEVQIFLGNLNEDTALKMEIIRIAYWKSVGIPLTNIADGGRGASGYRHDDETKKRMPAARVGRKHTPEALANMSAAQRARFARERDNGIVRSHSEESRKKLSESHKGIKHTPETLAKILAARERYTHSEETRAKIGVALDGKKRSVICIDTGVEYRSLCDAAKVMGASPSLISRVCYGKNKTAKGFRFQFLGAYHGPSIPFGNRGTA